MSIYENIFVTVGSTTFPTLIDTLCQEDTVKILASKGCRRLKMQTGRYSSPYFDSKCFSRHSIKVDTYAYKPDISKDIASADLIISHAGAGSCLEILRAHKHLIVVVNNQLMDNHQTELASELQQRKHLVHCTPDQLNALLLTYDPSNILPFPPPNSTRFVQFIDQVINQ